jgi:hypothetical protein
MAALDLNLPTGGGWRSPALRQVAARPMPSAAGLCAARCLKRCAQSPNTLGRDADTVLPCSPKPTPIFTPNEPQMERVCLGCRPPSQFLSGKME